MNKLSIDESGYYVWIVMLIVTTIAYAASSLLSRQTGMIVVMSVLSIEAAVGIYLAVRGLIDIKRGGRPDKLYMAFVCFFSLTLFIPKQIEL